MPAYTPGPWSTFKTIPGVYAENGREIVYHSHMTRSAETCERMANARLIASAPELLEALKILSSNTEHALYCDVRSHYYRPCNCYLSDARAAIAKAEGR